GPLRQWLKNAHACNSSHSRFWVCPLLKWRTDGQCGVIIIVWVEEISNEMQRLSAAGGCLNYTSDGIVEADMSDANYDKFDLHEKVVDDIVVVAASGSPMKREADLIDVSFDSGSMPYPQWHYPFENKEMID